MGVIWDLEDECKKKVNLLFIKKFSTAQIVTRENSSGLLPIEKKNLPSHRFRLLFLMFLKTASLCISIVTHPKTTGGVRRFIGTSHRDGSLKSIHDVTKHSLEFSDELPGFYC